MVVISSTTNEWPQIQQIDEKTLMASTTTGNTLMEKQEPPPPQQQPLKCPRCDSSNTKFCYYNNYSLSQPRHFCKACKRYWTRGGTLRNVPVGGGCRKNKRVKRPSSNNTSATSTYSSDTEHNNGSSSSSARSNPNHNQQPPHFDLNPLFYGLSATTHPSHDHHMNLPFSRFNSRVNGSSTVLDTLSGGYNHSNSLGLGFQEMAAATSTNSLLSSYPNYSNFCGSSPSSASPTMASLLASASLHQGQQTIKFMNGGVQKSNSQSLNHFNNLASFEGMTAGNNGGEEAARIGLGVKAEEGQNRNSTTCNNNHSDMDWNFHHQMEQIGLAADPHAVFWNSSTNTSVVDGGAWHDPSNLGSSVTSLI